MKIALLADIHANLPALQAVLRHASRQKVNLILNAGDSVGDGAFPNEVIRLMLKSKMISIAGNYDLKVLQAGRKKTANRSVKQQKEPFSREWTYRHLTRANRRYLASLPREARLRAGGKKILLIHGSPTCDSEYITAETPRTRLRELARKAYADVVVCGHSHLPFSCKVDDTLFINAGSVGESDDDDNRACYALLEIRPGGIKFHYHRLKYDLQRAAKTIQSLQLPAPFIGKQNADATLRATLELAKACRYEKAHTHQVMRLALNLFDELKEIHRLENKHRQWLQYAALLHDIGWIRGRRKHHKTALFIIQQSAVLPFDDRQRLIIGSIARYHRKALPSIKHEHYRKLSPADRKSVALLAALLRVADGLDISHKSRVQSLACKITPQRVLIKCMAKTPAEPEFKRGLQKGQLLEKTFHRKLVICRNKAEAI